MKNRSLISTGMIVVSIIAFSLTGCGGDKGITSSQGSSISPGRNISGNVTYNGTINPIHQIVVVVSRIGEQNPAYSIVLQQPGAYTIGNVSDASYNIFAFMDLGDDMGPPQVSEPSGYYDSNGDGQGDPVIMAGGKSIAGINITLLDPK